MTGLTSGESTPSLAWPEGRAGRLAFGALFVFVPLAIIVVQGFATADKDFAFYLRDIVQHAPFAVPAARQFLFEGALEDLIGLVLSQSGASPYMVDFDWTLINFAALGSSIVYSVYNRSLSPLNLLFILAFSRLVDVLAIYLGEFDPLLLAFLVLSANKSKSASIIGCVGAAFCHPLAAMVSICGVFAVELLLARRWNVLVVAVTFVACMLDYLAVHLMFPTLGNRLAFALQYYQSVIRNNLQWALPTMISAIVVPFFSIQIFRPAIRIDSRFAAGVALLWLFGVVLISCFLTQDLTRDALIITLAPMIVFLRLSPQPPPEIFKNRQVIAVLALLFSCRVVIPNFTVLGPLLGHYKMLTDLLAR
jgi:hypothetical protein